MKNSIRSVLSEAGIDSDAALRRFLDDEEMYFEFLIEFVEDKLTDVLQEAVAAGDVKEAFEAGHTLKGLCANLSIDSMSKILIPMVEFLRSGDLRQAGELLPQLLEVYGLVCQSITKSVSLYRTV